MPSSALPPQAFAFFSQHPLQAFSHALSDSLGDVWWAAKEDPEADDEAEEDDDVDEAGCPASSWNLKAGGINASSCICWPFASFGFQLEKCAKCEVSCGPFKLEGCLAASSR